MFLDSRDSAYNADVSFLIEEISFFFLIIFNYIALKNNLFYKYIIINILSFLGVICMYIMLLLLRLKVRIVIIFFPFITSFVLFANDFFLKFFFFFDRYIDKVYKVYENLKLQCYYIDKSGKNVAHKKLINRKFSLTLIMFFLCRRNSFVLNQLKN